MTAPVDAEHVVIDLQVISPDGTGKAASDEEPPPGGVTPRPILRVKAGDPLALHFVLINAYPHGRLDDVAVRYSVARCRDPEAEPTAKEDSDLEAEEAPGPANGTVLTGEVTMNFKPKCRVGARVQFRLDSPGRYLVRLETGNTKSDHEHFAAIEVEVR